MNLFKIATIIEILNIFHFFMIVNYDLQFFRVLFFCISSGNKSHNKLNDYKASSIDSTIFLDF